MECCVENNHKFQNLKERLNSKEIIVAPGIYDSLSGLFVSLSLGCLKGFKSLNLRLLSNLCDYLKSEYKRFL